MRKTIKVFFILTFFLIVVAVVCWNLSKRNLTINAADIVDTKNTPSSIERFYKFIKNIESGESDSIQLITYSKEGQSTIIDMKYDGKFINTNIDRTTGILLFTKKTKTKCQYTKIEKTGNSYYLIDESGKYKDEYLIQE